MRISLNEETRFANQIKNKNHLHTFALICLRVFETWVVKMGLLLLNVIIQSGC